MAIKIRLTQGFFATIDDDKVEIVSGEKWQVLKDKTKLYAVRKVLCKDGKRHTQRMHRLICGVSESQILVDHKDGDGLNNQTSNLRICNRIQNNRNKRTAGKSGYKGVVRNGRGWRAKIKVNGKYIELGAYATPEQAAKVYDEYALLLFGDFAVLNFQH